MTKKMVIGVQSGVSSGVYSAGKQWIWGRKVTTGGNTYMGNERNGGLCVSYGKAEADETNMGEFFWPLIYPKSVGNRSSTYWYVKNPDEKSIKHPSHYETGKDKYFSLGDKMDGWMYQTKDINSWADVDRNKNKIWWMDISGKRDTLYSICWTSMCDIDSNNNKITLGAAVNSNRNNNAWFSHIAYKTATSSNSMGNQDNVINSRKILGSRLRNVVGFSMNVAWNGKDNNSGNACLAPYTIGMIMQSPVTKKVHIVIPTVRGTGSITMSQRIDTGDYWGDGREDKITSANFKTTKGVIHEVVYYCTTDVITTIVNDKLEFIGLWWKLGRIGQGGGGTHAWAAMGAWNFRPHCVGPDGAISSTWNSGRYNIIPTQRDDYETTKRGMLMY